MFQDFATSQGTAILRHTSERLLLCVSFLNQRNKSILLLSCISQSVSQFENPDKACIYCHKGFTEGDTLIHVGSRCHDDQNKQHPINTLTIYAEKLKKEDLVSLLKDNKERKINTYIHLSCRNSLKNQSHTKQMFENEYLITSKRTCRRSEIEKFDFTVQYFCCGKIYCFDSKHLDRNQFERVATKDTDIYHVDLGKVIHIRKPF